MIEPINANLTQNVERPATKIDREIHFQDWLAKLKNNYYAQHGRVLNACERIN